MAGVRWSVAATCGSCVADTRLAIELADRLASQVHSCRAMASVGYSGGYLTFAEKLRVGCCCLTQTRSHSKKSTEFFLVVFFFLLLCKIILSIRAIKAKKPHKKKEFPLENLRSERRARKEGKHSI